MTHTDPFAPPLESPEIDLPDPGAPEAIPSEAPDELPPPTPDPTSPIRSPQDPG
ncbi:MAG: hypothetical protein ACK4Z5_03545 [Brevundimonas sp.]